MTIKITKTSESIYFVDPPNMKIPLTFAHSPTVLVITFSTRLQFTRFLLCLAIIHFMESTKSQKFCLALRSRPTILVITFSTILQFMLFVICLKDNLKSLLYTHALHQQLPSTYEVMDILYICSSGFRELIRNLDLFIPLWQEKMDFVL